MTTATVQRIVIQGPGTVWIPRDVAVCPECRGQLYADVFEWESASGKPTWAGVGVSCCKEEEEYVENGNDDFRHRNWQSDWQPLLDVVIPWCRRNVRIRNGEGGGNV